MGAEIAGEQDAQAAHRHPGDQRQVVRLGAAGGDLRRGRQHLDGGRVDGLHLHLLPLRALVLDHERVAIVARACDRAVRIRPGGRHRAADERGVVARMLGVQDEHEVKQMRFLRGVRLVGPDHAQEILRHGQLRFRIVQIQRFPVKIVPLGGEGVRRDERKARDQLDGLPQNVFQTRVVRAVVIRIERKDAARELVHDVAARCLEDHVLRKARGHGPRAGHHVAEAPLLRRRRQMAEQQQIRDLLIAERAARLMRVDDILDADAAVIELAGHRHPFAVHHVIALHAADLADADDDAGAVGVAKAALDALVGKIVRVDRVFPGDGVAQAFNFICQNRFLRFHENALLSMTRIVTDFCQKCKM